MITEVHTCPKCSHSFERETKKRRNTKKAYRTIAATLKHFGLRRATLFSFSQKEEVVAARHVIFYLMFSQCGFSHEKIGFWFDRNHTTVISGIKRVEFSLKTKTDLHDDVLAVEKILNTKPVKHEAIA